MSSSVVLIANPIAGSFKERKLSLITQILKKRGFRVDVVLSQKKGDIQILASQSAAMNPEIIFVLGGDGTFNEAINSLAHSEIPVSFIPSGTTNVLAKELNIPEKVERALENALKGKVHKINLGKISNGLGKERYFTMMAGTGFDAYSVYRVNKTIKPFFGKGAYIWSGIKVLTKYNPLPIKVEAVEKECLGYSVVVGNGSCYGGRFKITPDASLFDPSLSVFVLRRKTRISLLRAVFKIVIFSHRDMGDIEYFRTEKLRLEGSSHIQVDGDYSGTLPVDVTIERGCLNILF